MTLTGLLTAPGFRFPSALCRLPGLSEPMQVGRVGVVDGGCAAVASPVLKGDLTICMTSEDCSKDLWAVHVSSRVWGHVLRHPL